MCVNLKHRCCDILSRLNSHILRIKYSLVGYKVYLCEINFIFQCAPLFLSVEIKSFVNVYEFLVTYFTYKTYVDKLYSIYSYIRRAGINTKIRMDNLFRDA